MNRVLSLPITRITTEQLELLKGERHHTLVSDRGTIRLRHRNGIVEMKFLQPEDHLPPETPVCVWWKGGGFVCAGEAELEAEALEARNVADRVAQARSMLAAARMERSARMATPKEGATPETATAGTPTLVDVVQPETVSTY